MQHKISVDAMGGDFGPSVTIPASLKVLKKYENISIVLVGNSDEITQLLCDHPVCGLQLLLLLSDQDVRRN